MVIAQLAVLVKRDVGCNLNRELLSRHQRVGVFVGFEKEGSRCAVDLPINTRKTFSNTRLVMLSSLQRPSRPNAGATSAKPNKEVNLAP